jgi:hypothetical protein
MAQRKARATHGEHLIFNGQGPFVLPDLLNCERVEKDRWENVWVLWATTYEDRRLAIPLLKTAVTSLLATPPVVVPFETLARGRQIDLPRQTKPMMIPALSRFVCFRAIITDWWMPEFLTREDQRVLVPFSSTAYRVFFDTLNALSGMR